MAASQQIRAGHKTDIFYADSANVCAQARPTLLQTRYTQELSNKSGGTSVFTIPPAPAGASHVVIVLGWAQGALNNPTIAANTALALPLGWAYNALTQVSYRVGGSQQQFYNGDQILNRALRLMRTKSQRDSLIQLGGSSYLGGAAIAAASAAGPIYGYVVLPFFVNPSDDGISPPIPLDLLGNQVQITATIKPQASATSPSVFLVGASDGQASAAALPSAFDVAYFQLQQVELVNRGDSLVNDPGVDLMTKQYMMPIGGLFDQQSQTFDVPSTSFQTPINVTLSGFRSGGVKKIIVALQKNSERASNPLKFSSPGSVQLLYAGTVYSSYLNGSSQFWNLINGTAPPSVNMPALTYSGGAAGTWTASAGGLSSWCELDLAQKVGDDYSAMVLSEGLNVTNGIINLVIGAPTNEAYTATVYYCYNMTVGFGSGTADYLF